MKGFESARLIVEISQIVVHEADEPYVVVGLLDADGLSGEDLAEGDLLAIVADAAAGGHGDGLVMEGVLEVLEALIGSCGWGVVLGRAGHVEGLMGSFSVSDLDEVVELALLLEEVGGRRPGCFQLEGQMHALMAAVLLRVAGLDPLDLDAEPEPPDRELRQVEQGVGRSEGYAVVGPDRRRQATELLEGPLFPGRTLLQAIREVSGHTDPQPHHQVPTRHPRHLRPIGRRRNWDRRAVQTCWAIPKSKDAVRYPDVDIEVALELAERPEIEIYGGHRLRTSPPLPTAADLPAERGRRGK